MASAFFVVYVAISIPVIGEEVLAELTSLRLAASSSSGWSPRWQPSSWGMLARRRVTEASG